MADRTNRRDASTRIVDFLSYKRRQHQRRLNFESTPAPAAPSFVRVAEFRPLTDRALRHRERMIRHLSGRS